MQSYPYPDVQLLVFSKAPQPGHCKTRLIPLLGKEAAAEFQQTLIRHCLRQLCTIPLCPTQLWCHPDSRHPFFQDLAGEYSLRLHSQQGNDLGQRMYTALSRQDSPYTVIVGTDVPMLTRDYVERAICLLRQGTDAVIGPAEDGGYVLLGLNQVPAGLFQDVAWGTAAVYRQTCEKMQAANLTWHALDPLWDIDTGEDFQHYRGLLKNTLNKFS